MAVGESHIDFRRIGRRVARIDDLSDQAYALNVRYGPILKKHDMITDPDLVWHRYLLFILTPG
jgi:hypothetical protein